MSAISLKLKYSVIEHLQIGWNGVLSAVYNDLANRNHKPPPEKDDYLMLKRMQTAAKGGSELMTEGATEIGQEETFLTRPKKKRKRKVPKEELVDYDIFMPDIKGPDANKFFSDSTMLTAYLKSNDNMLMKTADNFQRAYLHEEPRILWQFEKLQNFGDYVILFPNPDARDLEPDMNNGISLNDAIYWFDLILGSCQLEFAGKKKFTEALQSSFEEAFVALEEFIPLNETEKRELEMQRTEQQKTIHGSPNDKSGVVGDSDGLNSVATKSNKFDAIKNDHFGVNQEEKQRNSSSKGDLNLGAETINILES